MKKKKYNLNELLEEVNENNLHEEILNDENVGREWPKGETEHLLSNQNNASRLEE